MKQLSSGRFGKRALKEANPQIWHGGIIVEPEGYVRKLGFTFVFAMRDELPFADVHGLWVAPQQD